MIKVLFLLLTIGFVAFIPQVFAQENGDTPELFKEAKVHFDKGEYKEAIQIYNNIFKKR